MIGEKENIPPDIQKKIDKLVEKTKNNTGLVLNIAFNYGGRAELVHSTKVIAEKVKSGEIDIEDINEKLISDSIYTAGQPDPDLMIRTSHELRTSNFFTMATYIFEFYFPDKHWPEFDREDLIEAIKIYQKRNRRFGGTPRRGEKNNENKIKRFISGMILFLAVAVILIFGNSTAVNLTISAVAIIAINEYFNSLSKKYKVERWIGNILAILLAFINVLPKEMLILMFPIGIALLFFKVIITEMKTNFVDIAITGFGIIYIIGFIMFIPLIYMSEHGKLLIWYLAISAWGTDTFAYLVGIKFGKHKLTPISPKKSIEGSIGGIVGSTLIAIIYTYFINKICNAGISYLEITGIAVVLSVLSQIGDLAASSIKRYVDIKDFGKIIPGHGGMLDRIDSILFIAPFAYFLLTMI